MLTDSYLLSHTGFRMIISVNLTMECNYTFDDAVAAAQALREISAGHEEAATAILGAAGLGALSTDELEDLRAQFGVEA